MTTKGILSDRMIAALAAKGGIRPTYDFVSDQIQPASLDLRLGKIAYRVRASFLPGRTTVAQRIEDLKLHEFSLTNGAVLETNCVYIVPLIESMALPDDISAAANPKSSTGRIDVFTRVIADRTNGFDQISAGYHGPLYAEISPKTFPVLVREGSRLSQIRFRNGQSVLDADAMRALHEKERLTDDANADLSVGVSFGVDLAGLGPNNFVGYRAKRHTGVIDVEKRDGHAIADFWEPIAAREDRSLILDPDEFYILASKEAVQVPPDYAAEMVPFDPLVGEFRVHYAGFFDPGFGYEGAGGRGARGVLEVRSREVPFILEHGQIVGRLVYERMLERPERLYGMGIGSNYQAQGLKLSKHFRV
jgi:dCTP deaminase